MTKSIPGMKLYQMENQQNQEVIIHFSKQMECTLKYLANLIYNKNHYS